MTIKYEDHDLDTVIRYWVKGYELPEGETIERHEYFIDPVKKRVVLRLWVDERCNAAPSESLPKEKS